MAILFDVSGSMQGKFSSGVSGSQNHEINNETFKLPIDLVYDLAKDRLNEYDKITPLVFGSALGKVVDFY